MRALGILAITIGIACGPGNRPHGTCNPGETHCEGLVYQTCVDGTFTDTAECDMACSEGLGCTACEVGTATCNGNTATVCDDSGNSYVDVECDPVQGMTCDPNAGGCVGQCSPKSLGTSYIGCDYYPTVTGNAVLDTFDFAVAIANTGATDAMVTIEGGGLSAAQTLTVPSQRVAVQTLPWQNALKLCNSVTLDDCIFNALTKSAALAPKGAYHLRSTVPVTVYQFNPLSYSKGADFSYTNDASLLLPTNVWRTRYYAASFQHISTTNPSELAITAMKDNTTVMFTPKASSAAAQGAPAFTAGTAQPVTLNAGDVLEVASFDGDYTGSLIDSDKPVQVISGHFCADVPETVGYCDHLEESMFPVDTLGTQYVINAPAVTSLPNGKVQFVRVIATGANTTLTYDPPQASAPTTIAQPGDFIEIQGNLNSFRITADQKVLVAQYMEGQDAGGGTGDPAMTLAVPVEQFRTEYLFHAPTNYESNYVDVTAPVGATVMLDGAPLVFAPIGTTGYALSRVYPLGAGPNNDGNHQIQGTMAFGITVYGYGQYTSYWYPGGLDLNTIIQ
ncbi:MAG TPA: IgGFc-binding protein [Kofleriaceae bacterium]|nr:IgGFc-binding protein [Kofleriaceae bacterium]